MRCYELRDLEHDDIPTLVSWLRGFSDSFDYPGKAPIDDEAVTRFVSGFIGRETCQAAIIAEHKGKPVAVIGFAIIPHPWTGQSVFFKSFWYSERAGAGRELLRYVRDMCKQAGVSQMIVSSMTPETTRILTREGYVPLETNYILEL